MAVFLMQGDEAVSAWVARWAHLVKPGGSVLDVACGKGRHSLYFLQRNFHVASIDAEQSAIDSIVSRLTPDEHSRSQTWTADIENGPWPLVGRHFDAVVVTNYLWRALMPTICASLAPAGVLMYETFAEGNETVGKPSRPDFLLRAGELLQVCQQAELRVIAYEDGFLPESARFVQRVVAVRLHQIGNQIASMEPVRYPL